MRTAGLLAAALLLPVTPAHAAAPPSGGWFSAWSRPQSVAVADAADVTNGGPGPTPLVDQTVRDVVQVTAAGTEVRIDLSDRYGASLSADGTTPLTVTSATVARRASGAALVPGTLRTVTFGGGAGVTVAPGATATSDPVLLPVAAGDDLAVSLHVDLVPLAPEHGASFVTSYVSGRGSGDHTADVDGAAFTTPTTATLLLTGVDVRSASLRGVIATTGGSVTDGFGSDVDGHDDFPSWLSRRIRTELPADQQKAVVNNGLGGTTAASACAVPATGPAVEERVGHDSLALPGVTDLIVYAGTNDIAGVCTADQIIAAYRSIIDQAHARGVRVLVSTITPRTSYTAAQNAQRELVNAWVRSGGDCSGACDRSLDFDVVIRDPADHDRIDPTLDSGDGMHPTGEGYRRIAASIPLGSLTSAAPSPACATPALHVDRPSLRAGTTTGLTVRGMAPGRVVKVFRGRGRLVAQGRTDVFGTVRLSWRPHARGAVALRAVGAACSGRPARPTARVTTH